MRRLAFLVLAACTSPAGGVTLTHEFPSITLNGGDEKINLCQSWTLGNDEPIYVNAVTLAAGSGWHHSNWDFVPEDQYPGDDGIWPCVDRNFDEVSGALAGGVLYAQSTQVTAETQAFPPGAVVVIPPHSKVIGSTHALNASPSSVTTSITLTIDGLAPDDVTIHLQPLEIDYRPLDIPASSRATFTTACDYSGPYQTQVGRAPDFHIYYVLGHYHALGEGATVTATRDGAPDPVFDTGASIGTPLGKTLDPPYSMSGATGLSFSCTFDNPRMTSVGWGFGDQEMCVMLAFTDSPLIWAGGNFDSNTVTGTDPDGTVENDGPCSVYALAPRN